jgi:hypothetical protein
MDDLTKLTLEYARHLLYKHQHSMGPFGGSAEYCNLWDLIQASLSERDAALQVAIEDIVATAKSELVPSYYIGIGINPDHPGIISGPFTNKPVISPGKSVWVWDGKHYSLVYFAPKMT